MPYLLVLLNLIIVDEYLFFFLGQATIWLPLIVILVSCEIFF